MDGTCTGYRPVPETKEGPSHEVRSTKGIKARRKGGFEESWMWTLPQRDERKGMGVRDKRKGLRRATAKTTLRGRRTRWKR